MTDSHEVLGRPRPNTKSVERRAQPDFGDVLEPQDLTVRTFFQNDVFILRRLVVGPGQVTRYSIVCDVSPVAWPSRGGEPVMLCSFTAFMTSAAEML